MKKTLVFIIITFIIVGGFTYWIISSIGEHIEDQNGIEDTSLYIIDIDERISNLSNSYLANKTYNLYSGGITQVSGLYYDEDYDHIIFSTSKFSGTKVVQATDVGANHSITFDITLDFNEGNLEIYILDPEFNILKKIDLTETSTFTITNTVDGIYYVYIGGESANFSLEINRTH